MPLSLEQLLERSRKELLDLSTRNRLLSIPVGSKSARVVQIHDELSSEVFRLLTTEKKACSFLPGRATKAASSPNTPDEVGLAPEDTDEIGLPQPEDDDENPTGPARRHLDARLQTALSSEGLQARLLGLFRDSQTLLEEQGVNILYLALGHLKWFEAEQTETARYAPLVLVPVQIQRKSATDTADLTDNLEDAIKQFTTIAIDLKG